MSGEVINEDYKEFAEFLTGLDRIYGVWNKETGKVFTAKKSPIFEHYQKHLDGEVGLGIVPIQDDNKCVFGVIDIDNHGEDAKDIDLKALEGKISKWNLPLVLCRSKSGGAHLYLFVTKPTQATNIRSVLLKWSSLLGYKGAEVFPKQTRISEGQNGSWINLPYFDHKSTVRYAIKSGNKLTLSEFIQEVKDNRHSWTEVKKMDTQCLANVNLDGAPPCLVHLYEDGIGEGHRNEAMYNFGVYYRGRQDDWEEALVALNYNKDVMDKPLPKGEMSTLCASIRKSKSYKYKCTQAPIVSYCDKDTCKKQKYGIQSMGGGYNDFVIGDLTKILSDPPRWIVEINDVPVEMCTEELMSFRLMRRVIVEKLSIVAPPFKDEDWLQCIMPKLEEKKEIKAPEDASVGGVVISMLKEFISAVDATIDGEGSYIGDKKDIMRGIPVFVKEGEESFVYFRGGDFINYLKRRRAEEAKGAKLWSILRQAGCGHKKVRIGSSVAQVWTYRYTPDTIEFANPVDKVKEEF